MSIREKIYTYYFYNYARMDYNLIAETENEEKIYYNPEYGKIVVFVEDKELGKKCYDTVKDLCRNKVKIQNLQDNEWDFVIKVCKSCYIYCVWQIFFFYYCIF